MDRLITSDETRQLLEHDLAICSEIILVSAYFTQPAYDWVKAITGSKPVSLIVRASPDDFLAGATSIEALVNAVEAGWQVKCISSLHAKVYLLDDKIYVGSGNLTANGLALFGSGNIELNTVISSDANSRDTIACLLLEGIPLNADTLRAMDALIEANRSPTNKLNFNWWPESVLPVENRKLLCSDFPPVAFSKNTITEEYPWTEIHIALNSNDLSTARRIFECTLAMRWLQWALDVDEPYRSFGSLTKQMHNDLAEDPAPYRKTVKSLLANLLSYVEGLEIPSLRVSRPKHRQIVERVEK